VPDQDVFVFWMTLFAVVAVVAQSRPDSEFETDRLT
jgi:hypothetical protein